MRHQRHRVVDRQRLGQGLRGARRTHAFDRVGGDQTLAAEPAVEAAPGREREGDAARRQAGAVELRRPAADVMHLRPAQRHRRGDSEALQPVECFAVERERARREAPLDRQVLEVADDVGVARRWHQVAGSSRVSAALATSPMRARKSVPMSAV